METKVFQPRNSSLELQEIIRWKTAALGKTLAEKKREESALQQQQEPQ